MWTTCLLFACLENITVLQKIRLELIDDTRGNKDEVEDGEQSKLEIKDRVANFPESEPTEECSKNVQYNLVPHVVLDIYVSKMNCVGNVEGVKPDSSRASPSDALEPVEVDTSSRLRSP